MHLATLLLIILGAGLASQWLAWQIRLPAIVILIASGLVLGPVTGLIDFAMAPEELTELIGLGVAIILFEGGMDLKLGEFRRVGHGVARLTTIGPLLAWLLGALAGHFVAGLTWPVAIVLGAILVVTGPTVILPLLRQARLNKESASLLKWEGIVNDPVGVLLAVLAFQYFTISGEDWTSVLLGLGKAVAVAALLGGLGGWLTGWFYRRGAVPTHLKPPMLMVLVLAAYWASNQVQHEAGLLTVTIMGLVLGNMKLVEREPLRHFKENLTVVLLSVLFIVIPTQLDASHLQLISMSSVLFVLAILFVVRPLTIALATIGAPMRWQDRLLMAWIAPRGIVAAATASIFGPALVAAGYPEAEILMPLVFLVILVTVVIHGLTLGPLARRLKLAAEEENGLLIVGASDWTRALANVLEDLHIDVLIADGSWHRLKAARMDGIRTYYGEVLSEHAEHELEDEHLSYLLSATDNDYYNALVCKALGGEFGHHRTFQLSPPSESSDEQRRLTLQQRGYFAFEPPVDARSLDQRLDDGWTIQTTRLSERFELDQLKERLGEPGEDWLLIGSVSPDGKLQVYSSEHAFTAEADWRLLYFAPGQAGSPQS
ncbi:MULTISPECIES: sodium:proton antiporter [unclassified Wenzhouxiangella]|uniref:cation:proton antiporter n=1 Tax=unclassified Wenzhouxiangella TaxID=2613841 RepID=UPI000E3274CD|nr:MULTISPECIES: sodium:proton antiporter [unclassified Wenzhouxiangella]RFF28982.1 sodium:proton antiporter [Wenzhouxiangella sp. 15181]RFP68310.1 sodium:proton antiporter [Wenzhouxiangella sp. 15190]